MEARVDGAGPVRVATARLVKAEDGSLIAESETVVTDEVMFDLIESGRR